jgi:hypothetical protein
MYGSVVKVHDRMFSFDVRRQCALVCCSEHISSPVVWLAKKKKIHALFVLEGIWKEEGYCNKETS